MKKFVSVMVLCLVLFAASFQPHAQASSGIKVIIDGQLLPTDQAPIMLGNRTLVPLRAIFEALNAKVAWNQSEKRVTATKGNTTITLYIGSRTAVINDLVVTLDVPATVVGGRTLVPVRFVSEALGDDVRWDANAQTVFITTTRTVTPVTNLQTRLVGENGDGRDLEVSFTKAPDESLVDHYRVLVVKNGNAASFNLAKAITVASSRYTTVAKDGKNKSFTLSAQARDVDGDIIRANQSYTVYVLTVGNAAGQSTLVLSSASPAVTVTGKVSVYTATNLKVSDTSDYGDGRDLTVSFAKANSENEIAYYRVFVVPTWQAGSFNREVANSLASERSTVVSKTGSAITMKLNANSRDIAGEVIKNNVSYTVYVLSVSSNSSSQGNALSAASSAITLSNNTTISAPAITKVEDVGDYGDGRDIRITFNNSTDESKVATYRIFVVKSRNSSSFNLTEAQKISSGRYFDTAVTGGQVTMTLHSGTVDVQGDRIKNGEGYRLFVMAVGNQNAGNKNALSSASSTLTLSNNFTAAAVTNLKVSDIGDFGDSRDLQVTFNKASDESRINHYRILVVKAANADKFSLAAANAVNSHFVYTPKTGSNLSLTLPAGAKDVDGVVIRNGVNYRLFVLSVSSGQEGSNSLSSASAVINLTDNSIAAVGNVAVKLGTQHGDGRDVEISFSKSVNETNLSEYRILVIRSELASSFNLASANAVASANYTAVAKQNRDITRTLSASARDVHGNLLVRGVAYKAFVLAVADTRYSVANSLSAASAEFTMTEAAVPPALITNVLDSGSPGNPGLTVLFNKASDETDLAYYAVMLVPTARAGNFTLGDANSISPSRYTVVSKTGGNLTASLSSSTLDVDGSALRGGVSYKVVVLSIANGSTATANTLSDPSAEIVLGN